MTAYYNEIDPFAAQWLRELIKAGHIAPGDVDERSIEDVCADDLTPYTQCHFFAGIGIWSHALRQAGWPDDRPVWTGSAPCQPFSQAGKGDGFDDDRHLWPSWFWLIRQSTPGIIFGEQVSSPAGLAWLDVVSADLESADYAIGAVDLCAAGAGAPHLRQRLYYMADSSGGRCEMQSVECGNGRETVAIGEAGVLGSVGALVGGLANAQPLRRRGRGDGDTPGQSGAVQVARPGASVVNGFWQGAEWRPFTDGKARAVKPGLEPLVNGNSGRVGKLRGYGNAIVAPLAVEFIKAAMNS